MEELWLASQGSTGGLWGLTWQRRQAKAASCTRHVHVHKTRTIFYKKMSMLRSMPFQRLTDSASRRMRSAGATRAGAAPVTPDRLAASVGSAWVDTSQSTDA